MEVHQLRYFVAVAETENFTQAAKLCHVSQPSLSQQIKKLEAELRQQLFDRRGRTVALTDAGRELRERAEEILSALDETSERLRTWGDSGEGHVRIGAIPTVAPYILPAVLRRFVESFPLAEIVVQEDVTEQLVAAVRAGELDIAIASLPIRDEALVVKTLFAERLLVGMPAHHRLARKKEISRDEIQDESFVVLHEIHCLGKQIVDLCHGNGFHPTICCRSAQIATVQEMISTIGGISLLPEVAVRADRDPGRVYRPLADSRAQRTLAAFHHRHHFQSPLVKGMLRLLEESLLEPAAQPRA